MQHIRLLLALCTLCGAIALSDAHNGNRIVTSAATDADRALAPTLLLLQKKIAKAHRLKRFQRRRSGSALETGTSARSAITDLVEVLKSKIRFGPEFAFSNPLMRGAGPQGMASAQSTYRSIIELKWLGLLLNNDVSKPNTIVLNKIPVTLQLLLPADKERVVQFDHNTINDGIAVANTIDLSAFAQAVPPGQTKLAETWFAKQKAPKNGWDNSVMAAWVTHPRINGHGLHIHMTWGKAKGFDEKLEDAAVDSFFINLYDDNSCIEVRTPPTTYSALTTSPIKEILETLTFGLAEKLDVNAPDKAGGGHINADLSLFAQDKNGGLFLRNLFTLHQRMAGNWANYRCDDINAPLLAELMDISTLLEKKSDELDTNYPTQYAQYQKKDKNKIKASLEHYGDFFTLIAEFDKGKDRSLKGFYDLLTQLKMSDAGVEKNKYNAVNMCYIGLESPRIEFRGYQGQLSLAEYAMEVNELLYIFAAAQHLTTMKLMVVFDEAAWRKEWVNAGPVANWRHVMAAYQKAYPKDPLSDLYTQHASQCAVTTFSQTVTENRSSKKAIWHVAYRDANHLKRAEALGGKSLFAAVASMEHAIFMLEQVKAKGELAYWVKSAE
jgi:hypothetical protein